MIKKSTFGKMPDGQLVEQYSLQNEHGVKVELLNFGGIIRRWLLPTKEGKELDIVLGFDNLEAYLADDGYLGATVGRYANRIAKGRFVIAQNSYQVDINQNGNCLHGGHEGFNSRVWQADIIADGPDPSVQLSLVSPDGDQGFPGELKPSVIYTLSAQNMLRVEYFALSDQDTLYNPTQHSYFNLAGHSSGSVLEQKIQVLASHYTPTDEHAIPSGEIADVENTPFDLREPVPVKTALASSHPQIKIGSGLDHNWCLDAYHTHMKEPALAAVAIEPASGRSLKISTTMPGMQVYTGNFLSDNILGKNNTPYQAHQAVCFESQFYPDAPNKPHFPSPLLKAGEDFYSVTEFAVTF
jgi:aldose 1-epimerase